MTICFPKRHLYLLFTFLFSIGAQASETTNPNSNSNTNSSTLEKPLSCEEKFEKYNCKTVIERNIKNKTGVRGDYLDCDDKKTEKFDKLGCTKHGIVGLGVGVVATTFAEIFAPVAAGYFLYEGLKAEEKCYNDTEYKKKLIAPYASYFGDGAAEPLMRLSCITIESRIRKMIRRVKSEIAAKRRVQEQYDNFVARRPGDKKYEKNANRRFPKKKRTLNAKEKRFEKTLADLKKQEEDKITLIKQISDKYRCASGAYKAQVICSSLGGGAGAVTGTLARKSIANGLGKSTTPSPAAKGPKLSLAQKAKLKWYKSQKDFKTTVKKAEDALGRKPLSDKELYHLYRAHKVGRGKKGKDGSPAGIGNYTNKQIRQKNKELKKIFGDAEERKKLFKSGAVGDPRTGNQESGFGSFFGFGKKKESRNPVQEAYDLKTDEIVTFRSKSGNEYSGQFGGETKDQIYLKDAFGNVNVLQKDRITLEPTRLREKDPFTAGTKDGKVFEGHYIGEDADHFYVVNGATGKHEILAKSDVRGAVKGKGPQLINSRARTAKGEALKEDEVVTFQTGNNFYSGRFQRENENSITILDKYGNEKSFRKERIKSYGKLEEGDVIVARSHNNNDYQGTYLREDSEAFYIRDANGEEIGLRKSNLKATAVVQKRKSREQQQREAADKEAQRKNAEAQARRRQQAEEKAKRERDKEKARQKAEAEKEKARAQSQNQGYAERQARELAEARAQQFTPSSSRQELDLNKDSYGDWVKKLKGDSLSDAKKIYGLPDNYSKTDVKNAKRKLNSLYHPDKHTGEANQKKAAEVNQVLNAAGDTLKKALEN